MEDQFNIVTAAYDDNSSQPQFHTSQHSLKPSKSKGSIRSEINEQQPQAAPNNRSNPKLSAASISHERSKQQSINGIAKGSSSALPANSNGALANGKSNPGIASAVAAASAKTSRNSMAHPAPESNAGQPKALVDAEKQKSLQELDNVLGDFEISLASSEKDYKGICAQCQQPIIGKNEGVQTAEGLFHSNCFQCNGCNHKIPSSTSYYVHPVEGKPYHIDCYEKTYLEECQGCHQRIAEGRVLHATGSDNLKRSFHPNCFRCGLSLRERTENTQPVNGEQQQASGNEEVDERPRGCQVPLHLEDNEGVDAIHTRYFFQDDMVYCQDCYDKSFLPQCNECLERIKNLDANGKIRFYTHESKPYCVGCYERKFVPECGRCQTKIKKLSEFEIDKFVVVNSEKYHRSCFNCVECGHEFNELKAYAWKKQFYCREHYDKVSSSA